MDSNGFLLSPLLLKKPSISNIQYSMLSAIDPPIPVQDPSICAWPDQGIYSPVNITVPIGLQFWKTPRWTAFISHFSVRHFICREEQSSMVSCHAVWSDGGSLKIDAQLYTALWRKIHYFKNTLRVPEHSFFILLIWWDTLVLVSLTNSTDGQIKFCHSNAEDVKHVALLLSDVLSRSDRHYFLKADFPGTNHTNCLILHTLNIKKNLKTMSRFLIHCLARWSHCSMKGKNLLQVCFFT